VRDLRFSGIGFKDSAASFLEPHSVPSAGDWALERVAALFFEGVERLVIENCTLSRAGGNGIMISGYSRDAVLHNNTVRWTGGSALAAWGRTDELSQGGALGWDATSGDFPQRTLVSSNLVTEVGVWEKQSSCWFQAKAALTELVGNVCFNGGRAGFNFNVSRPRVERLCASTGRQHNARPYVGLFHPSPRQQDGLGGGDQVHGNAIFNMNRESADRESIDLTRDRTTPFHLSFFATCRNRRRDLRDFLSATPRRRYDQ
jgi:hypothetical protein